jgi:hypothetical protein
VGEAGGDHQFGLRRETANHAIFEWSAEERVWKLVGRKIEGAEFLLLWGSSVCELGC